MHKLTVKLTSGTSPLDQEVIPGGTMTETISVEDWHEPEDILREVEKVVETIENRDQTTIGIEVFKEDGGTILSGNVQNGSFHGVTMS